MVEEKGGEKAVYIGLNLVSCVGNFGAKPPIFGCQLHLFLGIMLLYLIVHVLGAKRLLFWGCQLYLFFGLGIMFLYLICESQGIFDEIMALVTLFFSSTLAG